MKPLIKSGLIKIIDKKFTWKLSLSWKKRGELLKNSKFLLFELALPFYEYKN